MPLHYDFFKHYFSNHPDAVYTEMDGFPQAVVNTINEGELKVQLTKGLNDYIINILKLNPKEVNRDLVYETHVIDDRIVVRW